MAVRELRAKAAAAPTSNPSMAPAIARRRGRVPEFVATVRAGEKTAVGALLTSASTASSFLLLINVACSSMAFSNCPLEGGSDCLRRSDIGRQLDHLDLPCDGIELLFQRLAGRARVGPAELVRQSPRLER